MTIQLPIEALRQLRLMEQYFDAADAVVYESDLVATHGEQQVWQAIDDGILEHRRLPFSDGHHRCICWLTPRGRLLADAG